MRYINRIGRAALFVAIIAVFSIPAHGQSIQASTTVPLTLTSAETLSITTDHVGGATFVPAGANYATPAINISASWNLASTRTTGYVCQALAIGTLPGTASNYFETFSGSTNFFGQPGSSSTCSGLSGIGAIAPDIMDLNFSGNFNNSQTWSVVLSTQGLGAVAVGTYTGTYTVVIFVS
jgi:hypothetical protein